MHLSSLARQYINGLTHTHTRLSNHFGHRESDLSTFELLLASQSIFSDDYFLALNEHTSDGSSPRPLAQYGWRQWRLGRQVGDQANARVIFGLEASYLPDGSIDVPRSLAELRPFIIASRHHLPEGINRDPDVTARSFSQLCDNPYVVTLGHPMRHIEGLPINWNDIFAYARRTGTAVEVNYNTYLQATPRSQHSFWRAWLTSLAQSGAPITIGTDIHNKQQLADFVLHWEQLDKPGAATRNPLAKLILAMQEAGITPDRVVTVDYETLCTWLKLSKSERARGIAS